jgi:hypothetical protein
MDKSPKSRTCNRARTGKELQQLYLTSFVHREDLFRIAERWLCARPEPGDALRLTQIFISDGFVIGETLQNLAHLLLGVLHQGDLRQERIHYKGALRDVICRSRSDMTPRAEELCALYRSNPDYYYREVPINGVMCLDGTGDLTGLYRLKRPKRIAEKANRKIANWIFRTVQDKAQEMAEQRARKYGIPLQLLVTPEEQMVREFVEAEKAIAKSFSDGTIELDRAAMTIHDVAGVKIIAGSGDLDHLQKILDGDPSLRVIEKQAFHGRYRASSMILEVEWDREKVCRRYLDDRCWEGHLNRGIPEEQLKRGLEPLLGSAKSTIEVELILSTFPDMVESELGNSIHEAMIISQRMDNHYKGHVPTNVQFLLEYLFAVGFSPQAQIDQLPIKLWGRYLPDTIMSHILRLYRLPGDDLFY